MRASSSSIKNGFVYKRRKMQRNTAALLSGKNVAEVTEKNNKFDSNLSSPDYHLVLHEDSSDEAQEPVADHSRGCQDNEKPTFSGTNHLNLHTTFKSKLFDHKNLVPVPISSKNKQFSVREVSYSSEGFTNELCCSSIGNCNATDNTFATSKIYIPSTSISKAAEDRRVDCSNCGAIPLKSQEFLESPEEMCIYVLQRHGLLGESRRNSASISPKKLGSVGPMLSPCKICSIPDNAQIMLICDCCEEAFHLSCCIPKIKKVPKDQWYCQSCLAKKKKPLLRKIMGTPSCFSENTSESEDPISCMLRGISPHRSRARIGEDFQVEVPNWSDRVSSDDDYFGKPQEMDHVDFCSLEGWSWSRPSKSSSTGNWLQCKDEDDEGNICGKWRRAPLFSVQTNDWDCSCALLWDPIHADCSVHQELDTQEVLKQLKYVEMIKSRLSNKMKPV